MIDLILSTLAPHLCCGCGKIGTVLCDNCKYDISSNIFMRCIGCLRPTSQDNCCTNCRPLYQKAWCVGPRAGTLQRVIGSLKFQNMYAAHKPLAALLVERIDQLPKGTVIIPLPTASSHIRERGYDHMRLIARLVASERGWHVDYALQRQSDSKQRGASRAQRQAQAKDAYCVTKRLDPTKVYVLMDDVMTTGASIKYSIEALRRAGAEKVYVAIIARQILD